MNYLDGTPMPKSHQEWFDSGPVKPEVLEMWLEIIKQNKEREDQK